MDFHRSVIAREVTSVPVRDETHPHSHMEEEFNLLMV